MIAYEAFLNNCATSDPVSNSNLFGELIQELRSDDKILDDLLSHVDNEQICNDEPEKTEAYRKRHYPNSYDL